LYGYLNRLQSSRRLEREAQRNVELMWLTGRLAPDFKTIADFRKDNGAAIRAVCAQFVGLCRQLKLFTHAVVAIDGSKFKAVNNRDKNYTVAKVTGRMQQINASVTHYLRALDRADREEGGVAEAKSVRLKEKIAGRRRLLQRRPGPFVRRHGCCTCRAQDPDLRQHQARPIHWAGFHLRRREGSLHLPGRPAPDQGTGAIRPLGRHRSLPSSDRLLHL